MTRRRTRHPTPAEHREVSEDDGEVGIVGGVGIVVTPAHRTAGVPVGARHIVQRIAGHSRRRRRREKIDTWKGPSALYGDHRRGHVVDDDGQQASRERVGLFNPAMVENSSSRHANSHVMCAVESESEW